MIKFLAKSILISSVVLLASCSMYQKRFGGKSGDYVNAETTVDLKYPAGINAVKPSDRYSIPAVTVDKDNDISEVIPPDYRE